MPPPGATHKRSNVVIPPIQCRSAHANPARPWSRAILLCAIVTLLSVDLWIWFSLDRWEAENLAAQHGVPADLIFLYEERLHEHQMAEVPAITYPYRLMPPNHLSSGRRYPLLVFLHGSGERGNDGVRPLMGLPARFAEPDFRLHFPCYLLVPQCPNETSWSTLLVGDVDSLDLVAGAIADVLRDEPVDRDRVYLIGISMGGFGASELAARRPELFAAAVPIAGGGDVSKAHRLRSLPIRAIHGADDQTVPVGHSRKMISAIRSAGGFALYDELHGVGHDSWRPAFKDPEGVQRRCFHSQRSETGS